MPMLKVMECDLVVNNPSDVAELIKYEGELVGKSILINGELLSSKNANTTSATVLNTIFVQYRRRGLNVVIYKTKEIKLNKMTQMLLPSNDVVKINQQEGR